MKIQVISDLLETRILSVLRSPYPRVFAYMQVNVALLDMPPLRPPKTPDRSLNSSKVPVLIASVMLFVKGYTTKCLFFLYVYKGKTTYEMGCVLEATAGFGGS